MDVSDMIQVRSNDCAMREWLFQHQPNSIIENVERSKLISDCRQPLSHQSWERFFFYTTLGGAARIPQTGLIGTVMLIDANYPTGGNAFVSEEKIVSRDKSELASPDASTWVRWVNTTKELLQRQVVSSKPVLSVAATLRVERLTQIQSALGLPTLALAHALGITRQYLYKWLDATKEITLQETSRQRLAIVERLAKLWSERSRAPLSSFAHEPLAGGRTMLQMLTDEVLDEEIITSALDELVAKVMDKPKSLSQRMVEAGFKRRPSAHTLPADE